MNYTEEYYKSGNYKFYLESGERYKRTAKDIADLLEKLNLASKHSCILDYGCGVGFLMEGFKELGYYRVFGYDVSEWAIKKALEKELNVFSFGLPAVNDVLIALDVFEHMENDAIEDLLTKQNAKSIICRIPVSEDGKDFHLEVSRNDKTHINCKTKSEWIELFKKAGYTTFLRLNLISIYDAKGVLCLLALKNQE